MLSQYNLDIANIVANKAAGQSIEGSKAVDRLIEMRTVSISLFMTYMYVCTYSPLYLYITYLFVYIISVPL